MRLNASLRVFLMGGFATMMLASCQDNTASVSDVNETVENTEKAEAVMSKNTVLQKWTGPYGGVPLWDEIIVSDFPEAFQVMMDKVKAEIMAGLDAQQLRLVERGYEQLVRDGALLKGEDKEKLIALNTELSKQFNAFRHATFLIKLDPS